MAADLIFFALFLAGLTLMGLALGPWMARVFTGRARLLAPVERALYRAAGVTGRGQRWTGYAAAVLAFNAAGFVLLYLILRLQGVRRSTRRASARWNPARPSTPPSAS